MRIHKEGKGLLTKLMASILVVDAVVGWCCYRLE